MKNSSQTHKNTHTSMQTQRNLQQRTNIKHAKQHKKCRKYTLLRTKYSLLRIKHSLLRKIQKIQFTKEKIRENTVYLIKKRQVGVSNGRHHLIKFVFTFFHFITPMGFCNNNSRPRRNFPSAAEIPMSETPIIQGLGSHQTRCVKHHQLR